jgi:general secretion pathway protein L
MQSFLLVPIEEITEQWSRPDPVDMRDLAITLPPNRILRKVLGLPAAAEEGLRQVLEFQMDQHTPFSVNQVYFAHQIVARDFERAQLTVELWATPRNAVDAAIKTLGGEGAAVRAVFVQDSSTAVAPINLLPIAGGKKTSVLRSGINPWLASLVVLLALAAVTVPVVIKREAVVQMLPWVEKGRQAAEMVDSMRRGLEVRVVQHNFLLEKRQMLPTVIQILEELTRILPDDTWVQVLDVKGKELQIQGETASSVRLVGLFEQSSIFRDASFRSPLTKGQISGTERYQLTVQIRPAAPAASAPVVPVTPAVPVPAASSVQSAVEKKA